MKRIRVLALVLVFAFAALGGAYAAWSDSIFINETVETGIVNITWANAESNDSKREPADKANPDDQMTGYYNEQKLDVGSKSVGITDETESQVPGAYVDGEGDILEITLENGYPGYTATVTADIKNIGTIPVKCDFAEVAGSEVPEWMIVRIIDNDGVEYWNSVDGQLAATPTIEANGKITVKIHEEILYNAPQLAEATFSIEVVGIQWNAHGVQQAQ